MSTTTILITGSKAGIGKGLLSSYALRPNHTVIAAIRDTPTSPASQTLLSLPTGPDSKIIVATYDASQPDAATSLTTHLQTAHKITHIDTVIANAGILSAYGPGLKATPEEFHAHMTINTLAPLLLYQATQPLLLNSVSTPKFFIISSDAGSNTLIDKYPLSILVYGSSKAATNFIANKLHREEERIVVVAVHPGWVQTAMGEKAAGLAGLEKGVVPVTIGESVTGLMGVFDRADKEGYGGKLWDQNGEVVPW